LVCQIAAEGKSHATAKHASSGKCKSEQRKSTAPPREIDEWPNDQRNRAATLRVDFRFRRIRRSGSRNCSPRCHIWLMIYQATMNIGG